MARGGKNGKDFRLLLFHTRCKNYHELILLVSKNFANLLQHGNECNTDYVRFLLRHLRNKKIFDRIKQQLTFLSAHVSMCQSGEMESRGLSESGVSRE